MVIDAAAEVGVRLHRRDDVQTGVWHGDDKVCAIGVRLQRARVTLHGFAINCTTDLSWYDGIVACGLPEHGVTSLSTVAGRPITVEQVRPIVEAQLAATFDLALGPAPDTECAAFGMVEDQARVRPHRRLAACPNRLTSPRSFELQPLQVAYPNA